MPTTLRPRRAADYRTLVWMLLLAPSVMLSQIVWPQLIGYTTVLGIYLGISAAVVAHNHNHSPTFHDKRANTVFSNIISVFYGYPVFVWIPTHNLNHHKLVNRPGDATITWRHTNRHNIFVAATYFFVSAYHQSKLSKAYIDQVRTKSARQYRAIVNQFVVWIGAYAGLLLLAVALQGPRLGLKAWFFAVALPAFCALWTVHLFNYEQHVHTDPWSKYDHSRNFISPTLNFFLFGNGFHTAHHENPGLHWSELKQLDAKLAPRMVPELRQTSVWMYWLNQYVLAALWPARGTRQIGRAPFDVPNLDLTTEMVDATEAV